MNRTLKVIRCGRCRKNLLPFAFFGLLFLVNPIQTSLAQRRQKPAQKSLQESGAGVASKRKSSSAQPDVKLDLRTTEKLKVFLDRFAPFVPRRQIEFRLGDSPSPTGFVVIRYSITSSSNAALNRKSALLLSDDFSSVFIGHAMSLVGNPADVNSVNGSNRLSAYFSKKAGGSMKVSWGKAPGPGGAFPAKIVVKSPVGDIETPGAVSRNGKWFLFGTFFPLDRDPRRVRMKRLALKGRVPLGPKDAPVTLVELSDFQCSGCADLQPELEALVAKYAPKVRLVHVDLPQWRVHDWAMRAAEWNRCVERFSPGACWNFTDAIFQRQAQITSANFSDTMTPVIQSLGLKTRRFEECCNGTSARKTVLDDLKRAASAGISGTPTVLVSGVLLDMDIQNVLEPAVTQALRALLKDSQRPPASNSPARRGAKKRESPLK